MDVISVGGRGCGVFIIPKFDIPVPAPSVNSNNASGWFVDVKDEEGRRWEVGKKFIGKRGMGGIEQELREGKGEIRRVYDWVEKGKKWRFGRKGEGGNLGRLEVLGKLEAIKGGMLYGPTRDACESLNVGRIEGIGGGKEKGRTKVGFKFGKVRQRMRKKAEILSV